MGLYRVGVPSIGETWPSRFSRRRSTGGLGSGVYAFRDRWAAKSNESGAGTNDGLFVLENAVENPIQPATRDATDSLVRLSRVLSMLAERARLDAEDAITWERAFERGEFLSYSLTGGLGGTPGFGSGRSISSIAREVLFNTPELRDRYGYDTDEFVDDALRAAKQALERLSSGSFWQQAGVQPINVLLYPEYDGVCPLDGAGGNTGMHGCVVFKERIDACVGHTTDTFEEIPARLLNNCFA